MNWWIIIIVLGGVVLLCFLLSVANFSGERFIDKYKEMNKQFAKSDLTPLEFIKKLNAEYFEGKLQILQISKAATDAYNKGKLFLSTDTLQTASLASFTIIAHEMGHALQDKNGKKLKVLSRLRKIGRFLGTLMLPSILAGVILMLISQNLFWWGVGLIALGCLIFFLALFIKMRTISIEKDASKNAIKFLTEFFDESEVKKCKTFLKDARLTYWADFLRLCLGWTAMSRKTKLFN